MRKFGLINERGQSFELNNIRTGFMQNPAGLGYSMEYSFAKLGTYWKPLYLKDTQSTIEGEIAFGTIAPYTAQQEFLKFVRESSNITFYKTTTAGTYYKDVVITAFDISEIGTGGVLACPITMIATSLWYTKTSNIVDIVSAVSSAATYPYTFPSAFNDYADGYLTVVNDGSVEAAFTVEMYGAIANPELSIIVDGSEIAKVEITGSASSGERIIYSSKDGNIYCYKGTDSQIEGFKQNGITTGLTNLALSLSLSNENFFKFPIGTSKLHVTADSALTNPVFVEVFKSYRAV